MASGKIVANVNPETFHAGVADLVEMPAEANARLIAASPELLHELEEITECLADILDGYDDVDGRAAITKARSVINKAKGY